MSRSKASGPVRAQRRALRRIAAGLLSLLLITLILMFISPQTRLAVRTFALLPSFFASLPGSPIDLVTPAPRREVVDLAPVDGYVRAHIYRPAHGRNSALVISLGIDPAPPDDPRVVRLMDGIARSGIAAVLIESEALNQDQLFPDLPKALIEGVQFIQRQPYVRTDRVGLFGFSIGGSLALTAAADPTIAEQLRLVEAFGSYATLDDAILSIATRTLDDRGAVRPWQPLADAMQHLASALIGGISDSGEAAALRAWLVDGTGAEPDPEELSDEGRAIERLMTSRDRPTAAALLDELPARFKQDAQSLSPLVSIGRIRARLFIMYDANDPLLPYTGSRDLCTAASNAGLRPYCSRFAIFQHVDPTRGGNPLAVGHDLVELSMHAFAVLRRLQ